MTEIKTWHERCMEHPDHQTGMVSEAMIRARMCEEIEELRAEIERLRARVKELERADRTPRPPEELVGALHDRIHPTSGRLIHSSPIAPPTQEAKP